MRDVTFFGLCISNNGASRVYQQVKAPSWIRTNIRSAKGPYSSAHAFYRLLMFNASLCKN